MNHSSDNPEQENRVQSSKEHQADFIVDSGYLTNSFDISANVLENPKSGEIQGQLSRNMVEKNVSERLGNINIDMVPDCYNCGVKSPVHGDVPEDEIIECELQESRCAKMSFDEQIEYYSKKDSDGDTRVHDSILRGKHTRSRTLIQNAPCPAILNILNSDGHTPLHMAVLTRQAGIVRLLTLAGVDLTQRSLAGNTALHIACEISDPLAVKAMLHPVSARERTYLKRLPSIPQNLEIRNYTGECVLHVATRKGVIEIIRDLLLYGADLEAREGLAGKTPLMIAISERRYDVVNFFLTECRPNFETPSYSGLTAYQLALTNGHYELASRMEALGAIPEPLADDSDYSSDDEYHSSARSSPSIPDC